jgi:hypothetical protein
MRKAGLELRCLSREMKRPGRPVQVWLAKPFT